MDFLDSLESSAHKRKRSRRVRSWYLYEQYKSLEKNQLEATERLKIKTCQDKLLRQELMEHNARRSFCSCSRDSLYMENPRSHVTSRRSFAGSVASNEYFRHGNHRRSCKFDPFTRNTSRFSLILPEDLKPSETCEDDCSQCSRRQKANAFNTNNQKLSNAENRIVDEEKDVSFDMEQFCPERNLADDLKQQLDCVRKDIAENISMQLSAGKGDLQCLAEYKMGSNNELFGAPTQDIRRRSRDSSDGDSAASEGLGAASECSVRPTPPEGNVWAYWAKLVSFAHRVIQLNHGNCYYDYSSQFMTAVLACDMLCRGVNRMCRYLQPYVLPIEFDNMMSPNNSQKNNTSKCRVREKCEKKRETSLLKKKPILSNRNSPRTDAKHTKLQSCACDSKKYAPDCNCQKPSEKRRVAIVEPGCCRIASFDELSDSFWKDEFNSKHSSGHTENPMLKLTEYLDSMMEIHNEFECFET